MNVAFVGKGGIGKTTLAALTIEWAAEHYPDEAILAVDVDPACTLHYALGLPEPTTVGDAVEETKSVLNTGRGIPSGMTRGEWLRGALGELIVPVDTLRDSVDLLAMGRTEGRGCYCNVNHILRATVDGIIDQYDLVVMDTEAGMEHVSRRTSDRVDHLFVVAQTNIASLGVAKRILETADDVELSVGQNHLVLNAVDGADDWVEDLLAAKGPSHAVIEDLTVDGEVIQVVRDEGIRKAWMTGDLIGYEGPAVDALESALGRLIVQ